MGSVKGVVCVTGAGGYIASWLVKLLLSDGYKVHGTVRDPHDEKNRHLKKLDKATENLKLFKADLLDYDSLRSPISGCEGVFHTACPVPPSKLSDPESEMVVPAVTGTLNVLKICSQVKVRRVVVVSSGAAVANNPKWPSDKEKDETCWTDKEYCKSTENWYCYSKTLAEEEALKMVPPTPAAATFSSPALSISIWPPTQRTRDAVIDRLVENLTTPSVLTKRYVVLSSDEATHVARRIEEEAFVVASAEVKGGEAEVVGMDPDGFAILQIYSQNVSKRMLDSVKAKAAAAATKQESDVSASGSVAGESAEGSEETR